MKPEFPSRHGPALGASSEIVRRGVEAGLPAGAMRTLSRPPPPVSAAVADDHDLLGRKSQIAHHFSDQLLVPALAIAAVVRSVQPIPFIAISFDLICERFGHFRRSRFVGHVKLAMGVPR